MVFTVEAENINEIKKRYLEDIKTLQLYQRAADYLSAAQIYLQDNFLLRKPLTPEDIKPRLLGHWGTCPGINLIYAHLDRLIVQHNLDMFIVIGPGHGAPADLANLYLEGSLQEFYPQLTHDAAGLGKFVKMFSWPGGFPSHIYPGLPGSIHEGGELGYALATAFGAVMDNPNLIVACIVGDGEAETGPTATAWHSTKFLDPVESGAVLPIVHINGYKISTPTIYGTMSDVELEQLFIGYGYTPYFVNEPDIDASLLRAMEMAYRDIKNIQESARSGKKIAKPQWPVILLRSLKGWTGIKTLDGVPIEGTYRAHQVPAKDCKTNPAHLKVVEEWLRSYKPQELFDDHGAPRPELLRLVPKGTHRMGLNPKTFGVNTPSELKRQDIFHYAIRDVVRGQTFVSNVRSLVKYLDDVIRDNPKNFRIFSPDELESNQLNVFEVTQRDYQWPLHSWDTYIGDRDGRVLEILSEHTCQAWMQGYVLTGRYALFPSYEAFLGIIATMMDQYCKFIKMSHEIPWRRPVPSLNYIATSTLWRQEHNGFSHQNPGFVNTLLNKKGETVRIYLPPDANCLISTMDHCFRSKNYVNLVISNKNEMPQWLTMDEAVAHCRAGASIWRWASTDDGVDPDVVLVGIGDECTVEIMAAVDLLRTHIPELRVRVINVTDLLVLEMNSLHPHGLSREVFDALFTVDSPVIINFHGYPSALHALLFDRANPHRFTINGYREEGTTTTPFDLALRNGTSRLQVAIQAINLSAGKNPHVAVKALDTVSLLEYKIRDFHIYIQQYGEDPKEITSWRWSQ